jgi:hypothetical protein
VYNADYDLTTLGQENLQIYFIKIIKIPGENARNASHVIKF